jgi:hypothetical protein
MHDIYFSYKVYYISKLTKLNHIFLSSLWFSIYFLRKQQLQELKKTLYKSITIFLYSRSTPKKSTKIGFIIFGAIFFNIWILEAYKEFLEINFKTLLNPTGRKCYAHPAPSPRISVERQTGGPSGQRGPIHQLVPSRGSADWRDLADGELSGQAKMTGVTPPSREPNGARGVT